MNRFFNLFNNRGAGVPTHDTARGGKNPSGDIFWAGKLCRLATIGAKLSLAARRAGTPASLVTVLLTLLYSAAMAFTPERNPSTSWRRSLE